MTMQDGFYIRQMIRQLLNRGRIYVAHYMGRYVPISFISLYLFFILFN